MVILNLKSVASVKRTRLAANLHSNLELDYYYYFFYEIPREISKRFFYFRGETLNFEKICPKAKVFFAHAPFRIPAF